MTDKVTDRYCVLVNGHAVEPGCWVEGSWGQYGPDHLADRASELGWTPAMWHDDPRAIRNIIAMIETWGYPRDHADMTSEGVQIIASLWESHAGAGDVVEEWLNLSTETPGYHWGWRDGEFYLWPDESWEEGS